VESFQDRYGIPVTGAVDARTWTALFKSNVSFVSGAGQQVVTVGRPDASGGSRSPQTSTRFTSAGVPQRAARQPVSNRKPAAVPRQQPAATVPVSAPAPVAGGCGSGRIAVPVSGVKTGAYGESRPGHLHAGQDIAAPAGTAVRAAQCGTVTEAGWESGYGNLVCIQHSGGVSTCYAHLSEVAAAKGAYVHVGDVIGKVGCTGNCTGPHLHFEVRQNSTPVDPEPYLQGVKAIAGGTAAAKATTAKAAVQPVTATTTAPAAAPVAAAATAPAAPAAAAAPAPAAPVAPAPAPVEAAPTPTPAPVEAAPTPTPTPAPVVEAAPTATPAPVEAAPTATPAPVEAAPTATPAPVEAAPEAPVATAATPAA
jgi:Meckel syndrome type 1 protein